MKKRTIVDIKDSVSTPTKPSGTGKASIGAGFSGVIKPIKRGGK